MKGVIKGLLGDLDHDGPGLFKRQELSQDHVMVHDADKSTVWIAERIASANHD